MLFFIFGLVILTLNLITDAYFFLINNFRENLKMIIVEKDQSKVSHASLKMFMAQNFKYSENKIKSLKTDYIIKVFRNRFKVKKNLQFLIFGQDLKKADIDALKGTMTFKSLKTKELKDEREAEIQSMDDSHHIIMSKYSLE